MAKALSVPRQRVKQITFKDIKSWSKGDNTPHKNANQCEKELEDLIVHLVKEDFDASYNMTAKHVGMITGQSASANLIKGVRKRNGLEKLKLPKSDFSPIRTSYGHVVSIDVVRENGQKIFGFIRDKSKISYNFLASEHTAEQAVKGLKKYIELYGIPNAVRVDNGSEFKGVFKQYLNQHDPKIIKVGPLPYNAKANGFIERYFRTLRKELLRKLRKNGIKITQAILDDYSFLWNHCRQIAKTGKTPGELAGIPLPLESLTRFEVIKQTVGKWSFWHVKGINGILHAYMREEMLKNVEQKQAK